MVWAEVCSKDSLLDVSKVLAADSDDDDKTYENIAEIVQYTTLTGRRTNFATTIGNADIHEIQICTA